MRETRLAKMATEKRISTVGRVNPTFKRGANTISASKRQMMNANRIFILFR
jgi:hypothetical protein